MPQRTDLPSAEAAPGAGAVPDDTSQTNVQEAGVDEPDIVKTDGRVIWALEGGRLNAVDARAARPRLLSSLDLSSHAPDALLRSGDRMLVLGSGFRGAHLTQVDVSDPAKPVVMRTGDARGRSRRRAAHGPHGADRGRVVAGRALRAAAALARRPAGSRSGGSSTPARAASRSAG